MSEHPIAAGKSSFDLVDPQKVFAELNLQPDSILLDVACGIGNYAVAAAEFVGEHGMIHAVDLWAEGIATLRARARELGLSRLRAEVADVGRHLPLADASVDVALLATVLHDLAADGVAEGALGEIARVLKPGGRLVVIEFDKIESSPGPPVVIRLSPGEVADLVIPCGFLEEHIVPVGPNTYLVKFLKV
jgi:ubiquinone/menaquinone biosynthesis C-methylase UbiE